MSSEAAILTVQEAPTGTRRLPAIFSDFKNAVIGAARRAPDVANNFVLAVYFQPKQTLIDRPVAAFKAARNFADEKAEKLLPSFVPRDRTTKVIVGVGTTVWAADSWNPTSPVGETTLAASLAVATLRGSYLHFTRPRNDNSMPQGIGTQRRDFENHGIEFLETNTHEI